MTLTIDPWKKNRFFPIVTLQSVNGRYHSVIITVASILTFVTDDENIINWIIFVFYLHYNLYIDR